MELSDLQHRDIFTRPKDESRNMEKLGAIIYRLLRDLKLNSKIYGCYYTHYFFPPIHDPHIKVAIRYKSEEQLSIVNLELDKICEENKDIIDNYGTFKSTGGFYQGLSNEIIVDYIGCYSFEWLLKIEDELNETQISFENLAIFFINNNKKIDDILLKGKIYRNLEPILVSNEELKIIRGRFVHYIINMFRIPSHDEQVLKQMLSQWKWEIKI